MIKTVLKEIIIILLLCLAILLILSVLFYDYNPINKVVPSEIAYTVPEDIKEELADNPVEETVQTENKVYVIDGSDLNIYKTSNSYNPSKENPFATTTSGSTTTDASGTVNPDIGQTSSGGNNSSTPQTGNATTTEATTNNPVTGLK